MTPSDAGIFLTSTYLTMQRMKIDVNSIFNAIGLPSEIPDKGIRRKNCCQQRFWSTAEKITGNKYIGLHVGENFILTKSMFTEHLFLSSANFEQALKNVFKYQNIFTTALKLNLVIENDIAIIRGFDHPVKHYLEMAITLFCRFLYNFTNGKFFISKIFLKCDGNCYNVEEYKRVWKCDVELEAKETKIIFNANLLKDIVNDNYDKELLKIHFAYARKKLKNLENYELVYKIDNILENGFLEAGEITLNKVAEHLDIAPSNLRRNLNLVNTSFEKIVMDYRLRTAKKLLAHTDIAIGEIGYILGYSEISIFSRSFKQWTGESPSNYRKRKNLTN